MKTISMTDIKNEALARDFERAGRWFSAGPFFKTRLPKTGFEGEDGTLFFISSEKGPSGERRYTVRCVNAEGIISSYSEFQQFGTRAEANRWFKGER